MKLYTQLKLKFGEVRKYYINGQNFTQNFDFPLPNFK